MYLLPNEYNPGENSLLNDMNGCVLARWENENGDYLMNNLLRKNPISTVWFNCRSVHAYVWQKNMILKAWMILLSGKRLRKLEKLRRIMRGSVYETIQYCQEEIFKRSGRKVKETRMSRRENSNPIWRNIKEILIFQENGLKMDVKKWMWKLLGTELKELYYRVLFDRKKKIKGKMENFKDVQILVEQKLVVYVLSK